ncbi:MAG: hypothetical protein AAF993_18585 [Pseudomonadota bacterium]
MKTSETKLPAANNSALKQLLDVMHGRVKLSADRYIALVAKVREQS